MSDAIPIFEAKNKLPYFIHKAELEGPVYISRRNADVAVLLSIGDYNDLLRQVRNRKSELTFLERVEEFRNRNKGLYSDREIDEIFEGVRSPYVSGFSGEDGLWNGMLENFDE